MATKLTDQLTLDGWHLRGPDTDLDLSPAQLPHGWETPEQLVSCSAGLAYALDRWIAAAQPSDQPEPIKQIEAMVPNHPECYLHVYGDDSVYVHSNADDEIWASLSDYLAEYDCEIVEGVVTATA